MIELTWLQHRPVFYKSYKQAFFLLQGATPQQLKLMEFVKK